MWKYILASAVVVLTAMPNTVRAELVKKTVEYQEGGETCKSYLVYDDATSGKRPGVLVAPEWWGLNDYAKHRADMLAQMGYVAMAVDVYGEARVTKDMKQAGQWAGKYRGDRSLLRARMQAALDELKKQDNVDRDKIAAIGYCFGGTAVLELARMGGDVKGVVSFHGGLDTSMPAKSGDVKCKVLVLTGGADPNAPPEAVDKLKQEMKDAGADCKVIVYPGAKHGFTNPDNDKLNAPGIGYQKEADEKSWQEMKDFFAEIFK